MIPLTMKREKTMAKSLLDLMSPEERDKALSRAAKRSASIKARSVAVSHEMFLVGEMGYYFGWDAILAIRRGYTVTFDSAGKPIKEPFTLEEAEVLVEAAKKVWYSKVIDQVQSASSESAVKYYMDKARPEE